MIDNQRVKMVGGTGIEPVTPTMSRQRPPQKPAGTLGSSWAMAADEDGTSGEQKVSLRQVSAKLLSGIARSETLTEKMSRLDAAAINSKQDFEAAAGPIAPNARGAFATIAIERFHRQIDGIEERKQALRDEMATLTRKHDAVGELHNWFSAPFVMQKPNGSAAHRVVSAFRNGAWIEPLASRRPDGRPDNRDALDGLEQIFLVEHDWAAAFAKAEDFAGGVFRLPYKVCLFEFQISGHRVCAIFAEDDTGNVSCLPLIETKPGWCVLRAYDINEAGEWWSHAEGEKVDDYGLMRLIASQAKAISVALEAEIASTSVVRAPHKLNAVRTKRGELPVFDYHQISLLRRNLAVPLEGGAEEGGRSRRLHFVRGHWRHYEAHKTWIKWHLRGDPDLGFIDKQYRL